jgi:hypothetical protein
VDVSGSLSEQLSALTDALDDPGSDLPAILSVLVDDLTAAIPSFLGLTMTLELAHPFTLAAMDATGADTARTSLQVPLDPRRSLLDAPRQRSAPPVAGPGPGSSVTFYAATRGAFVDLAADAQLAWGLDGQVLLDQHLPIGRDGPAGSTYGLRQQIEINRALGVLVSEGHTWDRARAQLRHRALRWQLSEPAAAALILGSVGQVGR